MAAIYVKYDQSDAQISPKFLLGVWAKKGIEAKIDPSEDSFWLARSAVTEAVVRKPVNMDRRNRFAAISSSAAHVPEVTSGH